VSRNEALYLLALDALHGYHFAVIDALLWEDYAFMGEHDWADLVERVEAIRPPGPDAAELKEAKRVLAERAES
jgi:hypothetical protein